MVEIEWVPNLRSKLTADDGREFNLPEWAFFITEEMSEREKHRLFITSKFNRRQCKKLWHWLGRTDSVPNSLHVHVCVEDMERIERMTAP